MFNRQKVQPALVAILCTFFFLPISIHASQLEEEIEKLQGKYKDAASISFDFQQQTLTGGRVREAGGNALFLRKKTNDKTTENKARIQVIRWNYLYPSKQIILNDGRELSLFTAEDKQLIITSSDQLDSDITYGIFSGTIPLLDVFQILRSDQQPQNNDLKELVLIPKEPHPQLQQLQLWYSPSYMIKKIVMEDHFGSVTTLIFSNVAVDTVSPDDEQVLQSALHLDLPEGTEIIRQL